MFYPTLALNEIITDSLNVAFSSELNSVWLGNADKHSKTSVTHEVWEVLEGSSSEMTSRTRALKTKLTWLYVEVSCADVGVAEIHNVYYKRLMSLLKFCKRRVQRWTMQQARIHYTKKPLKEIHLEIVCLDSNKGLYTNERYSSWLFPRLFVSIVNFIISLNKWSLLHKPGDLSHDFDASWHIFKWWRRAL